MEKATPIATAHLFPGLHRHLIAVLTDLGVEDWCRPTVAGAWQVRDVVAHLIDVQLRRLSLQRDGHSAPGAARAISDYSALVATLDELNASWVAAMRRASPELLVNFLEVVGPQFAAFMEALDPEGLAMFPVAWAGERESQNWFDVGRDYTELWHHQAQIRLAVGAPQLEDRDWLHPVLALSVRGLRRSLAGVRRPDGTALGIRLKGEAGGEWSAVASKGDWSIFEGLAPSRAATVELSSQSAWRLFFNALSVEEGRSVAERTGDEELTEAVLRLRSVMV